MTRIFSIDQNCTTLWDVLPKVQALALRGYDIVQFVEDVDVAFTLLGADVADQSLRIGREQYHRSGGSSWGAALFYMGFLGRLPVQVRDWEPYTGLKTSTLARQLGLSVDDFFARFSVGDNWQLEGPSFVDDRIHHRVIGDLSTSEVKDFLRRMLQLAEANMSAAFPEVPSQRRLGEWFARERGLLEGLLDTCADNSLADLYAEWLRRYSPAGVRIDRTSSILRCSSDNHGIALLEVFTRDYDRAAALYNDAVAEAATGQRPLDTRDGELPFFAIIQYKERLVRTPVRQHGNEVVVDGRGFQLRPNGEIPTDALKSAGVRSLAGKALLLPIQVRLQGAGAALALPYRGSLYMKASKGLVEKLAACALLPGKLHPIVRVRFHLLDHMKSINTVIRLPDHLAPCFGKSEIPARELGENYQSIASEGRERLESFRDPQKRGEWQRREHGRITRSIEEIDRRRREMAKTDKGTTEARNLWQQVKELRRELLEHTVGQIARDFQARDIDYWDSRGALWPWSVALGGQDFYENLVANAEIYEESVPKGYAVE